jgi:glycosyltransferase involved in cell wall biosynthesis
MIDWYLPGTKAGGPVRSIHSLCEALKDEYEFCVFTSNKDLGSDEVYKNIAADTFIEGNGIKHYYFSPGNLNAEKIIATLADFKPDLIYLNSFWSYPFSIAIVKAKSSHAIRSRVLLAPRGMLGAGAMSLKSFKKQVFLMLAKIRGWYKGMDFHATNEQERGDILKQFPDAKINVAPNMNSGNPMPAQKKKEPGALKLFYLSRIARVKNLHFALEILKQIPSDLSIEYAIYGNMEDKAYWNECESIIASLPKNIKVTYKGESGFTEVQKNISPYHALLMPTLNENFGHSIVESLLCGCLVITSDQTPWNDMSCGYTLPLNQPEKFIEAIKNIANYDQKMFDEQSNAAINYISSKLNITKSKELYRKLFHE